MTVPNFFAVIHYIVFILFILMANSCGRNDIIVPDPELESRIRDAIYKDKDDKIYPKDLIKIEHFSGGGARRIRNLKGLEYMVSLKSLDISGEVASDLTPLRGLINLRKLIIGGAFVTNIGPLSELINLKTLVIVESGVSDLSPITGLMNLEEIIATNNQINDLSPLSELINLKKIDLRGNNVSNLGPLANLKKLQKLNLVSNRISDLSPLAGCDKLEVLDIRSNFVTDLKPLERTTTLQEVGFEENMISDISPMVRLYNNGGLKEGRRLIFVTNNPLNNKSYQEYIPYLLDHGVKVSGLISTKPASPWPKGFADKDRLKGRKPSSSKGKGMAPIIIPMK